MNHVGFMMGDELVVVQDKVPVFGPPGESHAISESSFIQLREKWSELKFFFTK